MGLPEPVISFCYAASELVPGTRRTPWGFVTVDPRFPSIWDANNATVLEPSPDLRAELTPRSMRVTGLVVGWLGAFERIGLDAPRSLRRVSTHTVVPWSAVVRASRRGIVVREGTAPR